MKKRYITLLIGLVFSFMSFCYAGDAVSLDIENTAIQQVSLSIAVKSAIRVEYSASEQYHNAVRPSAGYNVYNAKRTEYQLAVATRAREVAEAKARQTAYEDFISLLKDKYALSLQQAIVQSKQAAYASAIEKFKHNQITYTQKITSQQDLKKAQLTLQIKQRQLTAKIELLNASIGKDIKTNYNSFEDSNIVPTDEISSLQDYLDSALANRAEVLDAAGLLSIKKLERNNSMIAHPLPTDIFYQQSAYDIEAAQNGIEVAKINVQLDIISAYKDLDSKMAAWKNAKLQFDAAQKAYETNKIKYNLRKLDNQSLLDAEINKLQAECNLKNARLDAWLAQICMSCASSAGPGFQ